MAAAADAAGIASCCSCCTSAARQHARCYVLPSHIVCARASLSSSATPRLALAPACHARLPQRQRMHPAPSRKGRILAHCTRGCGRASSFWVELAAAAAAGGGSGPPDLVELCSPHAACSCTAPSLQYRNVPLIMLVAAWQRAPSAGRARPRRSCAGRAGAGRCPGRSEAREPSFLLCCGGWWVGRCGGNGEARGICGAL